jgi:FdhD protein
VELANDLGMTLIGRMRGERFLCLAGRERLLWDIETSNSESVAEPKNLDLK